MSQKKKAKKIKKDNEDKWLTIEEVSGVGIGIVDNQNIGIIILVTENPDKVREKIPSKIKGVSIKIQKSGELKALKSV